MPQPVCQSSGGARPGLANLAVTAIEAKGAEVDRGGWQRLVHHPVAPTSEQYGFLVAVVASPWPGQPVAVAQLQHLRGSRP